MSDSRSMRLMFFEWDSETEPPFKTAVLPSKELLKGGHVLDQTFTTENFRRIYDLETRKGANLEERFFPNLKVYTAQIAGINDSIRALRQQSANLTPEEFEAQLATLQTTRESLKAAKETSLGEALETLGESIRSTGFRVELTRKMGPKEKYVYPVSDTVCSFFIIKQLQRNLNRLYKVKQSDRFQQVSRVKDTLSSGFPFTIVRTDIRSFYESVDRQRLSRKLNEDHLLSLSSKRFIRQVLESFGLLSGEATGIPRGVGISAYLGELYLRPVDDQIHRIPGLVLYARYVDDIIAIFAPPPEGAKARYQDAVIKAVEDQGLNVNAEKTESFEISSTPAKFEYLGYRFCATKAGCTLSISSSKAKKYKRRLEATFREFRKNAPLNSRDAHRLLVQRVRFLTGNTRLLNNKSHAVTGIYYNNSAADDLTIFKLLDRRLSRLIAGLPSNRLKARLASASFQRGFENRRFHSYSTKRLGAIVMAWSHAS